MNFFLTVLPSLALLLSGFIHLGIAPDHFTHTPAHGLFFGMVGAAQVLWAIVSVWQRHRPNRWVSRSGILLSGGMIIVWGLTHLVATPFGSEAHPIDAAALATKCAELVAFSGLLLGGLPRRAPVKARRWQAWAAPLALSVFTGSLIWVGGLVATPLLPTLAEAPGHGHSGMAPGVANTSAYFSIVNAGRETDRLLAITNDEINSITLHETTIDDQQIAQMSGLGDIELNPHRRVDFSPGGRHVMLDALPRNLYEGDVLTLTLHFESGRMVPVDFEVRLLTPEDRVNFMVADDFQITNAWIRATASNGGAVIAGEGSYAWQLPVGFPLPPVPENNPMTTEKVELGRYLFYDVRLSGNGTASCSSCHLQALAFTDGRALGIGSTGDVHPRNSMTLTNAAYNAPLTWANPNLLVLERQIPIPMFGEHPVEMGITGYEYEVLARLEQDVIYQALFAAAYPDQTAPFTFNNVTLALSSFTRSLVSGNSAYDRSIRQEPGALSESAQRGMNLFFSEGLECHHCHTGFNFTLSTLTANSTFTERSFFNTGLYNVNGTGAYPVGNTGVHEVSNNANDMGRFRPPTLRNIALTAPYMHDGSIATLPEVIQFYKDGGRLITEGENAGDGRANPYKSGLVPGFQLTDQETADLIAFLHSLTDESFITDPRFSDPFAGAPATPMPTMPPMQMSGHG